jgi:hypothetical protein
LKTAAETPGDFLLLRFFCDSGQQAESIGTFWSHSWHGNQWKKILTLMTFYNGTAAIALGFVAAAARLLTVGTGEIFRKLRVI